MLNRNQHHQHENIVTVLIKLRSYFVQNRCIFVPSDDMIKILSDLGAQAKDFEAIQNTSQSLKSDPTLPFRRTDGGRFLYDLSSFKSTLHRLEYQPFILSVKEDFVRHDSDQVRSFREIEADLQNNTVIHALFRFKLFMIQGVGIDYAHRPGLDYTDPDYVSTLFHTRTLTTSDLVGEPALEGIHSDGVDFTMTTFLAANNMTDGSAMTFVHDNRETTGIPYNMANPQYLLATFQHRQPFDTLLFLDYERKHSLNPLKALDAEKEATRDMLIFFTRKPAVEGHVSFSVDSLKRHERLALEVDMAIAEVK